MTAPDPLSPGEFTAIYRRVPRLTVEVVIVSPADGVLLQLRRAGPCAGLWALPGGTVRFGEPVADAVRRVARDELGLEATPEDFLGYIEYPSHYTQGLDCPVGLAFRTAAGDVAQPPRGCAWFGALPDRMHDEQRAFLAAHYPDLLSADP